MHGTEAREGASFAEGPEAEGCLGLELRGPHWRGNEVPMERRCRLNFKMVELADELHMRQAGEVGRGASSTTASECAWHLIWGMAFGRKGD